MYDVRSKTNKDPMKSVAVYTLNEIHYSVVKTSTGIAFAWTAKMNITNPKLMIK